MYSVNTCTLTIVILLGIKFSCEAFTSDNLDRQSFVLYKAFNSTGNEHSLFRPAVKIDRNLNKKYQQPKSTSLLGQQKQQTLHKESHGISQIKSIYSSFTRDSSTDELFNTVRYIPSAKFDANNKLYFLFNLSLLTSSEDVLKSELFIHRQFIRQRLTFDLHYLLYSTHGSNGQNPIDKQRKQKTSGASMTIDFSNFRTSRFSRQNPWQSFNILESMRSYLSVRKHQQIAKNETASVYYTINEERLEVPQGDELVLMMEARFVSQRYRRFRNRRMQRQSSSGDLLNPYLMVFSAEGRVQMQQFFESRISQKMGNQFKGKQEKSQRDGTFPEGMDALRKFESEVDRLNKEAVADVDMAVLNKAGSSDKVLADYLIRKSASHESSLKYDDYLAQTDKLIYKNYRNQNR